MLFFFIPLSVVPMTRDISGRFRLRAFSALPIRFWSFRTKATRLVLLTLAAASLGVVGWSGDPRTLPLAMMFPGLWSLPSSRVGAALVAAAYFLGASRGLPEGVSIFFGSDLLLGLLLWGAASVAFVGVHAVCWTNRPGWSRPCGYLLANVLMSVPPFGIVGWANPITAAGVIFPGWGWLGLAMTIILLMATTTRPCMPVIAAMGALAVWSAVAWTDPPSPVAWTGVDTSFVSGREQYVDYSQQVATTALVRKAAAEGAKVVVLPESAFGIWTATTEVLWRRSLAGLDVTVIGGAVVLRDAGYDNLMVSVTARGSERLYRQRMPVPVSMWQPWTLGGASANFFENPNVEVHDTRLAILLCYEQLLVWPVLHSMLNDPDIIVATGNGWWTGSTNILPIQRAATIAWARLFERQVVLAFNAPT